MDNIQSLLTIAFFTPEIVTDSYLQVTAQFQQASFASSSIAIVHLSINHEYSLQYHFLADVHAVLSLMFSIPHRNCRPQ